MAAIVDELGTVRYWCRELDEMEIEDVLDSHPEWRVQVIWEDDYD